MRKVFLLFIAIGLMGCQTCLTDNCYNNKERERVIRLSQEERRKEKEWCVKYYEDQVQHGTVVRRCVNQKCYLSNQYYDDLEKGCRYRYREPTTAELEKLKNEKK